MEKASLGADFAEKVNELITLRGDIAQVLEGTYSIYVDGIFEIVRNNYNRRFNSELAEMYKRTKDEGLSFLKECIDNPKIIPMKSMKTYAVLIKYDSGMGLAYATLSLDNKGEDLLIGSEKLFKSYVKDIGADWLAISGISNIKIENIE